MLIYISSLLSDTEHFLAILSLFCDFSLDSYCLVFWGSLGDWEKMEVLKFLNNVFELHDYGVFELWLFTKHQDVC